MRLAAVCFCLAVVASACSADKAPDQEPDIAAFCDAITRPLQLMPIAMPDVDSRVVDDRLPAAVVLIAASADDGSIERISQRLDEAAETVTQWDYLGRDTNAEFLTSLGEDFDALTGVNDAIGDDQPRFFYFEGRAAAKPEFTALVEELRSLPDIAGVNSTTDPFDKDMVFEAPAATLFELLASDSLTPLVTVFIESDAAERDIAAVRQQLDARALQYWWFGQQQGYQEAAGLEPRLLDVLDRPEIPPSFRLETATLEEAETIASWIRNADWPAAFDVVTGRSEVVETRHAIHGVLLSQPTAAAAFDDMRSAAASELSIGIDEIAAHLQRVGAGSEDQRSLAFVAASALRDATVADCGIDPCLCDRSTGLASLPYEVAELLAKPF